MTNSEKIKMVIEEIKTIYPNKMVLNATQMTRIIGISLRTFSRIIASKEWNKIPQFKSEEVKRKDGVFVLMICTTIQDCLIQIISITIHKIQINHFH